MAESQKSSLGHRLSLRLVCQKWLFVYYMALLLLSLWLTLRWLIIWTDNTTKCIVFRSIALATLGNSMYYLRKLYKNAINQNYYSETDSNFCPTIEFGTIAYYILRPVFSIILVIIFYFLSIGQITFISDRASLNISNFAYFMYVGSFFIGFSTGRMLERVLDISSKYIHKIDGDLTK